MMDTLNANPPRQLALFRGETNHQANSSDFVAHVDPPVPRELLSLFESITGWVVEFEEAPTSRRQRWHAERCASKSDSPNQVPSPTVKGHFSIVDMSASWPAGRPTSHRAKCDQFVKLLSDLVQRAQLLSDELQRFRNSSLQTSHESEETAVDIADSFLPRYSYLTQSELEGDFEIASFDESDDLIVDKPERKDKAKTRVDTRTVAHSKRPWQIGGRRGIVGNRYIDWALRKDRRIELIVGQIESLESLGEENSNLEWESKLTINPETSRYWFSVEAKGTFWILDGATGQLEPIAQQTRITELKTNQVLVVTTAVFPLAASFEISMEDSGETADELAVAIQRAMETDEPVLVLSRQ